MASIQMTAMTHRIYTEAFAQRSLCAYWMIWGYLHFRKPFLKETSIHSALPLSNAGVRKTPPVATAAPRRGSSAANWCL